MFLRLDRHAESPIVLQVRTVRAVILRDIRTRFFGHGLGYLVSIGWPLAHVLILLIIYRFAGRTAPYGSSMALFFATGLVPYMSFIYTARFIMMSLVMNKPLTALPAVKLVDLIIARAILEMLASCCMVILMCLIFFVLEIDTVPIDVEQACLAMMSALFLGLGFGVVNAIVAVAVQGWMLFFVLVNISLYLTSGILFVPDQMHPTIRYAMSFNPAFHLVEWMRLSYFQGYTASALDKVYLLSWAGGCLLIGLATERLVRGRLLQ